MQAPNLIRNSTPENLSSPALRRTGADRIELLMLTHSDNDHAGGRQALVDRYPEAKDIGATQLCEDGYSWVWDRVRFTTLQYVGAPIVMIVLARC